MLLALLRSLPNYFDAQPQNGVGTNFLSREDHRIRIAGDTKRRYRVEVDDPPHAGNVDRLFVAEGYDWIRVEGTAGGQVASYKRDDCEESCYCGNGCGVVGMYVVKDFGHEASDADRGDNSDDEANDYDDDDLPDDQAQDVSRLRAEGHADAEF